MNFVFFGTPDLAVDVLDELAARGYVPNLVVTAPDKPQGRGLRLTPPPVKIWAGAHSIEVLQPEKINHDFLASLSLKTWSVFVVVAYGKILPQILLDIPKHGTLNVHPSLLPRWRGPSPVRAGILAGDTTYGVTVMLLDDKMDHGPVVAQKEIIPSEVPPHAIALEHILMREGGVLLADVLPSFLNGTITPQPQRHDTATYCKKITKEDGLLDLSANPNENLQKIRAYEGWPGTYAFFVLEAKRIRVKIVDAYVENDTLIVDRVIPEGKREMPYTEFLKIGAKSP